MKTIRSIFMFFNIFLALVTLVAFGAYYIHPAKLPFLPFIGLLFPLLLAGHIFFLLYWGFVKPKKMWLSILIILLGLPHVRSYLGNPFSGSPSASDQSHEISLMTYNIHNLKAKKNNKLDRVKDILSGEKMPDILCLQEHQQFTKGTIESWKLYKNMVWPIKTGTAIYTNYPVVNSGKLNLEVNTGNAVSWADILIDGQTVRCLCSHLESNKVSTETKKINEKTSTEELVNTSRLFYKRYNISVHRRIEQARKMVDFANEHAGPVIIMGDFNDVPLSYTYNIVSQDYSDSFVDKGSGISSTYKGNVPGIRIDYVFHSNEFETIDYKIIKMGASDHYPVNVKLKFDPQ